MLPAVQLKLHMNGACADVRRSEDLIFPANAASCLAQGFQSKPDQDNHLNVLLGSFQVTHYTALFSQS